MKNTYMHNTHPHPHTDEKDTHKRRGGWCRFGERTGLDLLNLAVGVYHSCQHRPCPLLLCARVSSACVCASTRVTTPTHRCISCTVSARVLTNTLVPAHAGNQQYDGPRQYAPPSPAPWPPPHHCYQSMHPHRDRDSQAPAATPVTAQMN